MNIEYELLIIKLIIIIKYQIHIFTNDVVYKYISKINYLRIDSLIKIYSIY